MSSLLRKYSQRARGKMNPSSRRRSFRSLLRKFSQHCDSVRKIFRKRQRGKKTLWRRSAYLRFVRSLIKNISHSGIQVKDCKFAAFILCNKCTAHQLKTARFSRLSYVCTHRNSRGSIITTRPKGSTAVRRSHPYRSRNGAGMPGWRNQRCVGVPSGTLRSPRGTALRQPLRLLARTLPLTRTGYATAQGRADRYVPPHARYQRDRAEYNSA